MMHKVSMLAAIAFLATAWGASTMPAPATPRLYVAPCCSELGIQAYPIQSDGRIGKPDFEIRRFGAPIAVGDDGTFYATNCSYEFSCSSSIFAFHPGSSGWFRYFSLPGLCSGFGTVAGAIAIDPAGYEFVLYYQADSGLLPKLGVSKLALARPNSGSLPCYGTMVFPPNAGPHTRAIAFLNLYASEMHFGRDGILYLASGDVYAIAHARTNPTIIRTLNQRGLPFANLSLDNRAGLMYAVTGYFGPAGAARAQPIFPHVFTYHEKASGSPPPLNEFTLPFAQGMWDIASYGAYLYVGMGNVLVYRKDAQGSAHTVQQVNVSVGDFRVDP